MGQLDADQPFEGPLSKRPTIGTFIPELFAIFRVRYMRETPKGYSFHDDEPSFGFLPHNAGSNRNSQNDGEEQTEHY